MDDRCGVVGAQESVWQTVKSDVARATGRRVLGVAGVLVWMAFQWGWSNDILLPPIVARAFDAVDDGTTWPSAIAAVSAATGVGGLFWAVTQALDAVIVLAGLGLVPGITERISRYLAKQGWVKPFSELSWGTRFLIAYASGASVLCLVDVFATGRQGLRSRVGIMAEAIALAVVGVGIAVAVVVSVTAVGRRVPATTDAADFILRYARNPFTWLVIYGSVVALSSGLARLGSRGGSDDRSSVSPDSDRPVR